MLEPDELAEAMESLFVSTELSGVSMMITAGPTWEAIDPVRVLTNHSSGRMGYALARAAVDSGARVTLVSGPTSLETPGDVDFISVISAQDMHKAVFERIDSQDIFIGVAAVADYRPEYQASTKIKKSEDKMTIGLVKNPDILADVAALDQGPFTVGFAAETDDVARHARGKLENKGLDLVVANQVGVSGKGFGNIEHSVSLIGRDFNKEFPRTNKDKLARALLAEIGQIFTRSRRAPESGNVTHI